MNWRTLEFTEATDGIHALVKGQHRESGKVFYGIGTIMMINGKPRLINIENTHPISRQFNPDTCDYWYIDIDEIK